MVDEIDSIQELNVLENEALISGIRRRAAMPVGVAGECGDCGEYSERIVAGRCAPCRDGRK